MPVTIETHESGSLLHLEGEFTISSAAELKQSLLQAFSAQRELRFDLDQLGTFDITALQLFWAAEREAHRTGIKFVVPDSNTVAQVARSAGFITFPGMAKQV